VLLGKPRRYLLQFSDGPVEKTFVSSNNLRNFFHFGAGSATLAPFRKLRYGNAIAWTLIVMGSIGWIVLIWLLPSA
jgi:hypothetical protein